MKRFSAIRKKNPQLSKECSRICIFHSFNEEFGEMLNVKLFKNVVRSIHLFETHSRVSS